RQGNDNTTNADDDFDVALASDDDEMKAYKTAGKGGVNSNNKRSAPSSAESRGKRVKKDQKFGFGGKKRHGKSNTADSSADVSGFSVKRNKSTSFKSGHKAAKGGAKGAKGGAKQRPGKSRRQSGPSRH
ncbi:rRNA-processing protein and EBNA1-binding protein ebp2, partial [Podila epicladia]